MLRRMVLVAVVGFTLGASLAFGKPIAEGEKTSEAREDNELKMKLL